MLPRDVFLDILYTHAKSGQCRIHTNKKMKSYAEDASGKLTLFFEDGAEFTADVLIGADGVHSRVRRRMFMGREDLSQPQFSGQFAYRMRCPIAEVERKYPNNASLNGFKIVRFSSECTSVIATNAALHGRSGVEEGDT